MPVCAPTSSSAMVLVAARKYADGSSCLAAAGEVDFDRGLGKMMNVRGDGCVGGEAGSKV